MTAVPPTAGTYSPPPTAKALAVDADDAAQSGGQGQSQQHFEIREHGSGSSRVETGQAS